MLSFKEFGIAVSAALGGAPANATVTVKITAAKRDMPVKLGLPSNLPLALPGQWANHFLDAMVQAHKKLGHNHQKIFSRWLNRWQDFSAEDHSYIYRARLIRFRPDGTPDSEAMADVIIQHARMSKDEWLQWKRITH